MPALSLIAACALCAAPAPIQTAPAASSAAPKDSGAAKPPAAASTTGTAATGPSSHDSVFVGKPAPDFTLPSQDGKPVSPKDFKGKWVVLYFYPKDFTGGCTLEAHNFQKDSAAYAKLDAVILGVSMQSQSSHKDFCAKEGLGFRLLADTAGTVSARYGSIKSIIGMRLSARNTFLIDPQGNIARIILDVKPAKHSEEVLAALNGMQKK
jgi:peroxiredoxin Q/BCP